MLMNSNGANWGSVLLKASGTLHENASELDTCYLANIEQNVKKTGNIMPNTSGSILGLRVK